MDKDLKEKIFLERCFYPSKIDGGRVDLERVEIPLVGITGLGSKHERDGKKSAWINGEILSPNFIGNDNCSCRSHVEGIVTGDGKMRVLEVVYNFIAHEGDCFEYNLQVKDISAKQPKFEGRVNSRLGRNSFRVRRAGEIYLILNPSWGRMEFSVSRSHSLPYHNRNFTSSTYSPDFWPTFLGEIEEQGYDHPYGAVSDKLKRERAEKDARTFARPETEKEESKPLPF